MNDHGQGPWLPGHEAGGIGGHPSLTAGCRPQQHDPGAYLEHGVGLEAAHHHVIGRLQVERGTHMRWVGG
jgi:hypothetical protein